METARAKPGNEIAVGEYIRYCGEWRRVLGRRRIRKYPDVIIVVLQMVDDEIAISAESVREYRKREDAPQVYLRGGEMEEAIC